MGVVYRAHDLALDRKVALKLLAPELAEDVRFRERFLRESRLAASLDHPAIVPIYDAGEVAGQLYIAMRLVDGTDLKRLLAEEGKLEPERALGAARAGRRRARRGARARPCAPRRQAVERPASTSAATATSPTSGSRGGWRSRPPCRRLGARSARSTTSRPSRSAARSWTGGPTCTRLAACSTSAWPGRPPFGGGSDTAVVFAHLEEEPPVLPGLEPVMRKALAKEPDDRYQSGRELVAAAREALQAGAGAVAGGSSPRLRWSFAARRSGRRFLATQGRHTRARPAVKRQVARAEGERVQPDRRAARAT